MPYRVLICWCNYLLEEGRLHVDAGETSSWRVANGIQTSSLKIPFPYRSSFQLFPCVQQVPCLRVVSDQYRGCVFWVQRAHAEQPLALCLRKLQSSRLRTKGAIKGSSLQRCCRRCTCQPSKSSDLVRHTRCKLLWTHHGRLQCKKQHRTAAPFE